MSLAKTLVLGLVAGGTIVLGLPIGRLRTPAVGLRALLNATAIGVLLFLFWDVLSAAWEPLDLALGQVHDGAGAWASVAGFGATLLLGLAASVLGLAGYEQWMKRSATRSVGGHPTPSPDGPRFGPGAMSAAEAASVRVGWMGVPRRSPALRLAFLIAVGIGLHNFAEGLAIGQSAASGDIALATVLVIGFALHNGTEGFGIVAPLTAQEGAERPSWALLGVLALIGGGPTFLGTLLGHGVSNEYLSVAFLALAAGSILYVVTQLLAVAQKARRPEVLALGLLLGLVAGFATDAVVTLAGV